MKILIELNRNVYDIMNAIMEAEERGSGKVLLDDLYYESIPYQTLDSIDSYKFYMSICFIRSLLYNSFENGDSMSILLDQNKIPGKWILYNTCSSLLTIYNDLDNKGVDDMNIYDTLTIFLYIISRIITAKKHPQMHNADFSNIMYYNDDKFITNYCRISIIYNE